MEIQQLKGFLAVAKYGGFSVAAEKTFRTQPAITLQIQSLERELKTKLFDRLGAKKITLTEDGKTFFELLSPLMEDLDTLTPRFNEMRGKTQKGSVTIATHTSVMVYLLPEVLKTFKSKFPECELTILNRSRQDIMSMLINGEADIGIASLSSAVQNIDYTPFADFKRLLIAPKNHPLAKKTNISLETIAKYPLLLPPQGSNTRTVIDQKFKEKELSYNLAMEVTGRQAIKTYVQMGMGISVLNEFYITAEDKKSLFIKDMSRYFRKAERGILTRKNKYLSVQAKALIKLLK